MDDIVYSLKTAGSEVVSLTEMKEYLRILDDDTQDTTIQTLIDAWTQWAEGYCWRSFNDTVWEVKMPTFQNVTFRKNPVKSITVTYTDPDDASQTLAATDYVLYKTVPARIEFEVSPSIKDDPEAIVMEITTGDANVLPIIKSGIMYLVSLQFWKREDHMPTQFPDQAYISIAKHLFYPIRLNHY